MTTRAHILAVLVPALLVACGGETSEGTRTKATEGRSPVATTDVPIASPGEAPPPTSEPSVADPQSGGQFGVQCLRPAPEVIERIVSRTRPGIALVTRRAVAAQADDIENLYFVSLAVDVSGASDTTTGLAVWAVTASAWRGEPGAIVAADAHASRITSWPLSADAPRPINQLDRRVSEVNACHLV